MWLKSSTLCTGNVHIHGTALAKLFDTVLFIIFGDGQVLARVKTILGLKSQSQSTLD